MKRKKYLNLIGLLVLLCGNSSIAAYVPDTIPIQKTQAQAPVVEVTTVSQAKGWHFLLVPYLWMSDVRGEATVRHATDHVNVSFSEILKRLDFAFQGHAEANYEEWTLMADVTYLKLSNHFRGSDLRFVSHIKDLRPFTFQLDVTSSTTLIDFGVFYQVSQLVDPQNQTSTTFELLGGGRYIRPTVDLKFNHLNPTLSSETNSLSPIVGARIKYHFDAKTVLWLRGDMGGWHVNHMDNTWSAIGGVSYAIRPNIDLGLAYRFLDMELSKNTNVSFNTQLSGPIVGIAFHL